MSVKLDLKNRSALEFYRNKIEILKMICTPLKQFGIRNFTYVRFYNGGKRLYITTNTGWLEFYLENNLQDVTEHAEHYVPPDGVRYSFWKSFSKNKVFEGSDSFKNGNGFTIYEKHADYVDYYDFIAHKNNVAINAFYLNNLSLLESFVSEFKNKILNQIDFRDKSKLIVPKTEIIFQKIEHTAFVEDDKIKKFMQQIKYKPQLSS